MKKTLLILILLGSSVACAQPRVNRGGSIGIGINLGGPGRYVVAPPPPPPVVRYVPRSPGRNYVWVPGYWEPRGRNYRWRDGYWAKPPRGNARWVGPRYRDQRYYDGYWR